VFAVVWLAVAALTRYSSVAALAATLASPIAMAAIGEGGAAVVFAALGSDRSLALPDPLLARPTLVVEGDDIRGRPRRVGDDEADARVSRSLLRSAF
jgi:hypothetical protein